MSHDNPCAICGAPDKPTRICHMDTGVELRCDDCLYFGTSGPPPADPDAKPRSGESLTAWLDRTGRKRPGSICAPISPPDHG